MKFITIVLKTFFAHIIIYVTTLAMLYVFSFFNVSKCIFLFYFVCILFLYLFSGYLIANHLEINWYDYFGIAIVGIVIWGIAITLSPDSLNYKRVDSAGVWLFYRIYISGIEIPLNFIEIDKTLPIKSKKYFDLILPFIASTMQYFGALLKFWSIRPTCP